MLRSAWDGLTLEVLTRGKSKLRASNAHVSILAHITPEELAKLLTQSVEVANGFANRFLWALARRSNVLPEGGDPFVLEPFHEPLRAALAKAKGIGRVVRDEGAKALWASVYEGLTASRPGAYGMAVGRGHAQTLRLSLIYALMDGSEVIKVEHLKAASAVWAYCEHSARIIFGKAQEGTEKGRREGEEEPLDFRLLMMIEKNPGVKRTDLLRAFRSDKAEAIGEALAGLVGKRLAHHLQVQGEGGGRPAECWFPGEGDDPLADSGKEGINSGDGECSGNERKEGINSQAPKPGVNSLPELTPDAQHERKEPGVNSFLPKLPDIQEEPGVNSFPPRLIITADEWELGGMMSLGGKYSPEVVQAIADDEIHKELMDLLIARKKELKAKDVNSNTGFCPEAKIFPNNAKAPKQEHEANVPMVDAEPPEAQHKAKLPTTLLLPIQSTQEPKYAIGQRVNINGIEDELTIVEASVYGANAQYYMLVHDDPAWRPPFGFDMNMNYKPPRLLARLDQVQGSGLGDAEAQARGRADWEAGIQLARQAHTATSLRQTNLQNSLYVDS